VVTASDWIAARKMRATAPTVTQTKRDCQILAGSEWFTAGDVISPG
jgi:hypothetical protein